MEPQRLYSLAFYELTNFLVPALEDKLLRAKTPDDLLKSILSNPTCAVSLGYRYERSVRHALSGVTLGPEASETQQPVSAFGPTILRRAWIYLHHASWAFDRVDLQGLASPLKKLVRHVERISDFAAYSRPYDQLRTLLEGAGENHDAISDALELGARTLVDARLDAALWAGQMEKADSPLIPPLIVWIRRELLNQINGDWTLSNPANWLWGALFLAEKSVTDLSDSCSLIDGIAGMAEQRLHVTYGGPAETGKKGIEITPELYVNGHRSLCYCLFDLFQLRSLLGSRAHQHIETMRRECLSQLRDQTWPAWMNRNLHFLAQRIVALHDQVELCEIPPSIIQGVEVNLAEFRPQGPAERPLLDDYLVSKAAREGKFIGEVKELQKAITRYLSGAARRPLNVLVGGAPGTGKSYFVKNLTRGIPRKAIPPLVEVNAAQLRDVSELPRVFKRVTSEIAEFGFGLLFVDEVDASVGDKRLFPSLLMPMWDGEYVLDGELMNMKRTVCFYAVSLHDTCDAFESWLVNTVDSRTGGKGPPEKGRDFHTRVQWSIDVPPADPEMKVLMLVSSILRHHKATHVQRRLLHFVANHVLPNGARGIENLSLLVGTSESVVDGVERQVIAWDSVPTKLVQSAEVSDEQVESPPKNALNEFVSIVDL